MVRVMVWVMCNYLQSYNLEGFFLFSYRPGQATSPNTSQS